VTIAKITDHADGALSLLLSQFAPAERLRALVAIFAADVQRLENVAWDVLTMRRVDTAERDALARIGAMCLIERLDSDTDAEYRDMIRTSVTAWRSHGTPEDVLATASAAVGETVQYIQSGAATVVLCYATAAGPDESQIARIVSLINRAVPSGVAWRLYEASSQTTGFRLNSSRLNTHRLGRVVGGNV